VAGSPKGYDVAMGRLGGATRAFSRDIGGMPVWALILSAVVAVGAIGAFSMASAADGRSTAYTLPSDAATPQLPQPMPLVAFLGDSYTQGVGGGGVTWPDLVGKDHGWDIANLALGGTGYLRTSDERGCGRPYCGRYIEASQEIIGSPRIIFVAGGRNDLRLETADIAAAAEHLFADLRERYPAAQLFVVNPWYDDDAPPAQLATVTTVVRAAAGGAGAVFLETGQPLEGEPDLIVDDGVHPNSDGYRALAAAVAEALEPHLE